jgi:hypothetical protein
MSTIASVSRNYRPGMPSRTKRSRGAEPIEMRERRYGYFPKVFVHRGTRHEVYAVERCWTVSRRRWGGRVERHYFRVRCVDGMFELYQDVRHNTWHLDLRGSGRRRGR